MGCCSATVLISIFSILLLLGVLELTVVPLFVLPAIIKSQAAIRQNPDGSFPTLSKYWSKLPVVQHFRFYMFNITNPVEVLSGAPVKLQEKGPYTYLETEYKTSIRFLDNGNQVYYKNNKTWVFSPELSCPSCRENDEVFNPNGAYMAVASIPNRQKVNPLIVKLLNLLLIALGEEPLRKTPVRNLLYDSYDDPLINLTHNPIFKAILKVLGNPIRIPNVPAIGYFPHYNNSDDGEFVVKTGKQDFRSLANIVSWNTWDELPWWKEEINRNLLGCDGAFNKPLLEKTDTMRLFNGYICRMLPLKYQEDVVVGGIKGYRLAMEEDSYDTTKEKNKGLRYENFENVTYFPHWFSSNPEVNLPPGIIPLRCLPGKPIPAEFPSFFSASHFVTSPPEVTQNSQLIGLSPDPAKHSGTYLDIEPTTGATMHALARLQLNIAIHNSQHFTALKQAKAVIILCLWLEIEATMNDKAKNYIWFSVTLVKGAIFWSGIGPSLWPPKATKAKTFQFNHSVTGDHTARYNAMHSGGRRVWERFFKHPSRLWLIGIYALFCILLTLNFQRYIFSSTSEFQEKAPELPVMYKDYCIQPNVFHNEYKDYDRIAQILHVSANYLDERLEDQVLNWNAPVSLSVVLLHPQQYSCVFNRLKQTINSNPLLSQFLRVHILFPSSWSPNCSPLPLVDHECIHQLASVDDIASYPANIARNAARMFSSSKYYLIADYEHMFSRGFEEEVRKVAEKELENTKKLLVYRIFEIEKNATVPETKEDLEEMMKEGEAVVFHSKFYRGAHDIPQLKEWFAENITDSGIFLKDVKYKKSHWEPQFVSRSDIPLHDTDFPFLIRDNTVLRWELCRMGYQLDILSNHFMYHRGIKTKQSKSISKPVQAKNYSRFKKALAAFTKRMDKDFPDKGGKCPKFRA